MPKVTKGPLVDTPQTAAKAGNDPLPSSPVVDSEPHILGGPVNGPKIDHDKGNAKDQAAKEAVGDSRADQGDQSLFSKVAEKIGGVHGAKPLSSAHDHGDAPVIDEHDDDDGADEPAKPAKAKKADLPVHLRKATFDQVIQVTDLKKLPEELTPFESDIRHDEDRGAYIRLATAEGAVAVFEGMWLWEAEAADGAHRWHAGLSDPRGKG